MCFTIYLLTLLDLCLTANDDKSQLDARKMEVIINLLLGIQALAFEKNSMRMFSGFLADLRK